MAFSVNTNVGAMVALQSFEAAQSLLDGLTSQVSTGLRVTGAVDDAADFSIAQGVRSDIKAWSAVGTALDGAQGVVNVTIGATTQVSNLLGELRKQVIEYFSTTDPNQQTTLQNAVNQTLDEINTVADSATYNGTNLVTSNEASAPPAPSGQGQTFTLTGGGSNTQPLGSTAGSLIVNFTRTSSGGGGGNLQLVYNGSVVASYPINNAHPSGSLTFNYPASPSTNVTVNLTGSPSNSVTFSFVLNFPPQSNTASGSYQVIDDIQGNTISIQHRSLLTSDLGFTSNFLNSDLTGALAQISDAEALVGSDLGYYGSVATQVQSASDMARKYQDALTQGLGALVDANLQQDSAALAAAKVRQSLVLSGLSIANAAPNVLLGLLPS
jgi:flagellin